MELKLGAGNGSLQQARLWHGELISRPAAIGRRFGALRGAVRIDPEFFEPLSEVELTDRE